MRNKWKNHRWKIVAAAVVLCLLGFTFWYGGSAPGLRGWNVSAPTGLSGDAAASAAANSVSAGLETNLIDAPDASDILPAAQVPDGTLQSTDGPAVSSSPKEAPPAQSSKPAASPSAAPGSDAGRPLTADEKRTVAEAMAGGKASAGIAQGDAGYSRSRGMEVDPGTGKDRYLTDPVPEGKPVPAEPQDAVASDRELTCTLSVRCDTILDNMDWLDREKWELVPADGVIFPAAPVTFHEGESVFNLLQREMKKAGIQMEFANTPMYNSAYIEGVNNLYEFDCGELSGWMYRVNGWFPNYGCSRYQLHEGDVVEWVYTCDLGIDVGGYYATGGS